jgi:hypothetical protein
MWAWIILCAGVAHFSFLSLRSEAEQPKTIQVSVKDAQGVSDAVDLGRCLI